MAEGAPQQPLQPVREDIWIYLAENQIEGA